MAQDKKAHMKMKDQVRTLILAGYHVDQIAEALGFSNAEDVRTILEEIFAEDDLETRDFKRKLENQRLEELKTRYWPLATRRVEATIGEQYKAVRIYLRLIGQQTKLLGLNIDPKVEALKVKKEKYTVIWDVFRPLKKDGKSKKT